MGNTFKGLEEGRAIYAYNCVQKSLEDISTAKKYKSYAKKIPTLIQNNGLGPAMAFVFSKIGKKSSSEEKAYFELYNDIENWLREKHTLELNKNEKVDLIRTICERDSIVYREFTMEILSLFNWIRRFVDGMIDDDKATGGD